MRQAVGERVQPSVLPNEPSPTRMDPNDGRRYIGKRADQEYWTDPIRVEPTSRSQTAKPRTPVQFRSPPQTRPPVGSKLTRRLVEVAD